MGLKRRKNKNLGILLGFGMIFALYIIIKYKFPGVLARPRRRLMSKPYKKGCENMLEIDNMRSK